MFTRGGRTDKDTDRGLDAGNSIIRGLNEMLINKSLIVEARLTVDDGVLLLTQMKTE